MSTDVEFRLTLTRDPQARAALRQWEADLLASIARVEAARLRAGAGSLQTLHRMQMQLMGQQQAMQNQNQAAQQMALQRSLAAQAAMWRAHAAQIAALMRHANTTGLPPGGGGGGAGGAAGGTGARGSGGIGAIGLGAIAGRLGPAAAVYGSANFASESVQSYANLESQQVQLKVLTGSSGAAKALTAELKKVSQAFGVTLQDLSVSAKLMIGFGVNSDDAADKLKRFSAITGGNADAMNRLGRAYGQTKGLGKLMAEETNQMIDAGFSPLIAIADRTGETIGQVRERMKAGGVSFDEVRESIEGVTDALGRFGPMMEEMTKTTTARIGRMRSAWTEFYQDAGGFLLGKSDTAASKMAGGELSRLESLTTGALKGGSQLLNPTEDKFVAERIQKGKALVAAGYDESVKDNFVSNILSPVKNSSAENIRAFKLDKQQADVKKSLSKRNFDTELKTQQDLAAAKIRDQRQAENEYKESRISGLRMQTQEIGQAQKLNDLRLKSAKDELKARREILEDAKKATAEAGKALMTAQERFGAMTTEEQNAAVNDLLNARRNGVGNLSLEQINRIKSIGTKEADQISGAALRNRAGAAFGLTNPEDSIAGRTASIQQEIARLQNSNAARMPVTRKERRDNDARINQLRQEASQFEGTAERARGQYQQQVGVRNSLFTQERRDLQLAERKQLAVEANVQQSIQFVAKFDQTAQQIATQVMELFTTASNEQMKEVLKIINPIKKQVEAAQMRRIATAQQG